MPSGRLKQSRSNNFVTRSLQNINISALDLASISYCSDKSERTGQIYTMRRQQRHHHQPNEQLENVIEGDSSTPLRKQNVFRMMQSDEFNQHGHNVIFTTGELKSHLNASWYHCGQCSDAHIQNAFVIQPLSSPSSSVQPQQPHRSTIASATNQSEDKRPGTKESNGKEKRKLTRRLFVTVFSICYALFLIVFAAIIFIGDVVGSQYPLPQIFCIYMLLIAFAYFLYLYIDIQYHIYRTTKQFKHRIQRAQQIDEYINKERAITIDSGNQFKCCSDASFNWKASSSSEASYAQAIQALNAPSPETMPHRYCFTSGRNGSNYVKLGASWFAFGLLVYSALRISYDAFFIASYGDQSYECASFLTLSINILFPLYALLTFFFIIKYMDVVINVNKNLARIFLFHAIGTSLSLWVYTIIHETADAIAESDDDFSAKMQNRTKLNETFDFVYNDCGKSNALNAINRQFAPYLYPFVIEYCILVVATCCKVYENIGHCKRKQQSFGTVDCEIEHRAIQKSFYVYGDFKSSVNGISCGLMFLIVSIVCIISVFVGFQNRGYLAMSIMINRSFEACTLFILIITTIIAYAQIINLDIRVETTLQLDDILLLIAVPAFFMDCIFSVVPAYKNRDILQICIAVLRILDVLIQTAFIIDGQRRYIKRKWLHDKKPGRQIVIFLAIVNMALWIHQTFSNRNLDARDERFEYYGNRFWNILDHTCVPLMMFYRFHASVCLVDIWNHAFKPIEHHQ